MSITHLDVLSSEVTTTDHVENTTWRSADDLLTRLKLSDILSNTGTTDTSVTRYVHVITQGEHDGLDLDGQFTSGREDQSLSLSNVHVQHLQRRNGKGGGFTRTGLRLRNDISTPHDGVDCPLLDRRWLFEVCQSVRH